MPELPEVETLRRGLDREIPGRRIREVVVADTRILKGQSEATFRSRVVGHTVSRVDRRGKYLLLPLAAESQTPPSGILCIHLKMRGQLLLKKTGDEVGKYHCLTLVLADGGELRYHDMWAWGEMRALSPEEAAAIPGLAQMGPEPLEATWQATTLAAALAGRKTAIKPTLLDQRVVAGVGNIYADESLYRAGIHPTRRAGTLTVAETERLADAVRAVLTEAVEGGGTMSDEYVDLTGRVGRYTPRVYDRGGAPCGACGTALERIRLGGRGTVYCPKCQS